MPPKKDKTGKHAKTPQEDAEEEARMREKETRARILAVAREQKIKAEAEKAQLPVGILQAVGGLPPEESDEESEEESEVEMPTWDRAPLRGETFSITRPPTPYCSSEESSPGGGQSPLAGREPTSFCATVPASGDRAPLRGEAMMLVGGMVFLSG